MVHNVTLHILFNYHVSLASPVIRKQDESDGNKVSYLIIAIYNSDEAINRSRNFLDKNGNSVLILILL